MRVFLDSNVVLTGAFNPQGPAATLAALQGQVSFIYSDRVLEECLYLVQRDAPSAAVQQAAEHSVRSYLANLRALQVPDASPPPGIAAFDEGDHLILGAALASKSDALCSYNIKDFPPEHISIGTPLAIHRSNPGPRLEHFIQPINLSSKGTLLFFGSLHHESSMGPILQSDNGVTVLADEQGFIRLTGAAVKRFRTLKPLPGATEFRLVVRYKENDFEAALWRKDSITWHKEVITSGTASFSHSTTPILCFVQNPKFSGHIQCISGLPRFVRDKQMPAALDKYSLEAVAGSLDLKRHLSASMGSVLADSHR
jgi:predicted nucleic acid-binding protein